MLAATSFNAIQVECVAVALLPLRLALVCSADRILVCKATVALSPWMNNWSASCTSVVVLLDRPVALPVGFAESSRGKLCLQVAAAAHQEVSCKLYHPYEVAARLMLPALGDDSFMPASATAPHHVLSTTPVD